MPRAKRISADIGKNRKRIFERLEKFCEDSGLGKTVTLERTLNMYMDEYYVKIGLLVIDLKNRAIRYSFSY